MKQTCQECNFQFHLTSQRFFCCDQTHIVCSTCRRKHCPKCKKPRTIQIIIPKCSKCRSRLYQNDLLLEQHCGRYYCSKCLSDLFKDAYFKVSIQKFYEGQDLQLAVRLHCGHEFLYEELIRFFQHFCLSCGRQYDSVLDYELNDGVKLCFLCYRDLQQFFAQLLIKCEFCQAVIKNSSFASILDNSETAICQKCTMESKIQENFITESRKKQEKQFFEKTTESKHQYQKPQPKHQFVKSPLKPPVHYAEQKPAAKSPLSQMSDKQQQKSPSVPKYPLSKLFKKPSISQLKQKQQKRASNNKSSSISVTSRFSNNFQQIDKQITESMGLPQDFKLKKHLSNQTYVENYLIQVPENNSNNFVSCKRCCGLVELKVAFNLYDFGEEMNKCRATTISFRQNGSILSISNQENSYFVCRVCYFKSAEREKSILNASISIRAKSSMSNRPSKLEETTSSMNFLKPGKSARKDMRSPSPNKQYSLTGSKDSFSVKETKSSLLLPEYSIKNPQSAYQKHSMSRETTSQSIPQRFMKCQKCRGLKKSLIATLQGYYCDDCYYGKGLYSDPFLGKL